MNDSTRILLTPFLVALCACAVVRAQAGGARPPGAQTNDSWVRVAPEGEAFTFEMPRAPEPQTPQIKSDALRAEGRLYSVTAGDVTYSVWSLTNQGEAVPPPPDDLLAGSGPFSAYMDACAELAWDLVVRPKLKLKKAHAALPLDELFRLGVGEEIVRDRMEYAGQSTRGYGTREYRLVLGKRRGFVDLYSDGRQVYVVAASGPARDNAASPEVERFLGSFTVRAPAERGGGTVRRDGRHFESGEGRGVGTGDGIGTGVGVGRGGGDAASGAATGAGEDPNRPLLTREVTRKAVITSKPEPGYTQKARFFSVTGTVKLRVVLASDGRVTHISVLRALPHGLTEKAIEAARQIRFTPAQKDGRPVSQWIIIEYNFNIY